MRAGLKVAAASEHDRVAPELIGAALRAENLTRVRVGGSSMVPAIWPGDTIEIIPARGASIEAGQVVFYIRDGRTYAHRVVVIEGRGDSLRIVTRGDALVLNDPPSSRDEILGIVSAVIRFGRRIPIAGRSSSPRARLLTCAVRNSAVARRLILGIGARRRRWMMPRCPV